MENLWYLLHIRVEVGHIKKEASQQIQWVAKAKIRTWCSKQQIIWGRIICNSKVYTKKITYQLPWLYYLISWKGCTKEKST